MFKAKAYLLSKPAIITVLIIKWCIGGLNKAGICKKLLQRHPQGGSSVSSTNRGAVRNEADFYPTPAKSVYALLDRVGDKLLGDPRYNQRWLEPAVGDGAIIRAVSDYAFAHNLYLPKWDACDIRNTEPELENCRRRYGILALDRFKQCDWLKHPPPTIGDFIWQVIMTNPSFLIAQPFIEKAVNLYGHCNPEQNPLVIMLLRLNFLGSKKRSEWWQLHKPDALYVLSDRPDFTGGGGDSCEYAWYFWNWEEKGIHILPPWKGFPEKW